MEGSTGSSGSGIEGRRVQDVVVMRHSDRVDRFDPLWVVHAPRPWDPPLTDAGRKRAWRVGKRLRASGFLFHRVLVSPFIRCLQTASEVVRALCAVVEDESHFLLTENSGDAVLDPSRVKVSIEYGISETLNSRSIAAGLAPSDDKWFPDLSELEALLPPGTVDRSTDRIYQELPKLKEPSVTARNRYVTVIQSLADKYPNENLLLVTHGHGVDVAISSFLKDAQVHEMESCAFIHLQRQIMPKPPEDSLAGQFKVSGQTGVSYSIITPETE